MRPAHEGMRKTYPVVVRYTDASEMTLTDSVHVGRLKDGVRRGGRHKCEDGNGLHGQRIRGDENGSNG
jgi:hypothetical protein